MYVCMSAGFFFFVLRYGCWLFPHEELLIFFFFFCATASAPPFPTDVRGTSLRYQGLIRITFH